MTYHVIDDEPEQEPLVLDPEIEARVRDFEARLGQMSDVYRAAVHHAAHRPTGQGRVVEAEAAQPWTQQIVLLRQVADRAGRVLKAAGEGLITWAEDQTTTDDSDDAQWPPDDFFGSGPTLSLYHLRNTWR